MIVPPRATGNGLSGPTAKRCLVSHPTTRNEAVVRHSTMRLCGELAVNTAQLCGPSRPCVFESAFCTARIDESQSLLNCNCHAHCEPRQHSPAPPISTSSVSRFPYTAFSERKYRPNVPETSPWPRLEIDTLFSENGNKT